MGEGKVCGTCGDIGIVGALVTCTQCKVVCEHRYCMSELYTVASGDWCCAMCRSTHDLASSEDVSFNLSTKPSGEKKGEPTRVGLVSSKLSESVASGHNIVKEVHIKAAAEEPLPTDPAPNAAWMGSFIFKDEETSISVQAHPTSKGLSKVKLLCEEMPKVLEFELFSYKEFLRTVFEGCDPDEKDIGLYFFPDNMIRPEAYISRLELLSGNYFLRSCVDGVELLVFTSKVLHKDYRERNKCDFLWGIYRRRHRKLKGADETMVVDMDINAENVDMVGGDIVGPVDVIVPKQSVESNIDIPPGFSTYMRDDVDMVGGDNVGPVDPKQSVESNINIPAGFSIYMRE